MSTNLLSPATTDIGGIVQEYLWNWENLNPHKNLKRFIMGDNDYLNVSKEAFKAW